MTHGHGARNSRRRYAAEINVTPLVDVVLVLLIIFMITAPMMTRGIKVDLPETTAKALPQKERPQTVTVDKNGRLYLNSISLDKRALKAKLRLMKKKDPKLKVLLKADKEVPYGLVAGIMADLKEAGIEEIGLVTRPSKRKGGF
ncbi:Biopolymer transport protein ExbD/TolR [Dissulfuribacter thermophilus]|uniref:Biopolymer transport protein ExbD/TolR n=2 Tax=Dissulfuribacter thermophilus TaxID=1156395 RepID=A0A1B9F3R8_9BACT|nr:Biopolymer transport protein ExbD/TolR [Dissulfuribacter thermophilus]